MKENTSIKVKYLVLIILACWQVNSQCTNGQNNCVTCADANNCQSCDTNYAVSNGVCYECNHNGMVQCLNCTSNN